MMSHYTTQIFLSVFSFSSEAKISKPFYTAFFPIFNIFFYASRKLIVTFL